MMMKRRVYTAKKITRKAEAVTAYEETTQTINELGEEIIEGLGGRDNIEVVDNCYTRLESLLKMLMHSWRYLEETGAKGVVRHGNNVQVVYGLHMKKCVKRSKPHFNRRKKDD